MASFFPHKEVTIQGRLTFRPQQILPLLSTRNTYDSNEWATLDHALVHKKWRSRVMDSWSQADAPLASHHCPLSLRIQFTVLQREKPTKPGPEYWNRKLLQDPVFKEVVRKKLQEVTQPILTRWHDALSAGRYAEAEACYAEMITQTAEVPPAVLPKSEKFRGVQGEYTYKVPLMDDRRRQTKKHSQTQT